MQILDSDTVGNVCPLSSVFCLLSSDLCLSGNELLEFFFRDDLDTFFVSSIQF